MDKRKNDNVQFSRKVDYNSEMIEKVKTLIKASNDIECPILAIPGVDCIYCYYAGYSFVEISDRVKFVLGKGYEQYFDDETWEAMHKNYDEFLFNSDENWKNLRTVLKGVERSQPRDYERHTQHEIAIRNIKYDNNSYSVCGFETAIPEHYFNKEKKPEADLVVICPAEHRIVLVEFKCRISSLSGRCGVVKHCTDYVDIVNKCEEINFISEMVKAFNLMNELYNGNAKKIDASDITQIDIAFLLTGSSSRDNEKNAKGKIMEKNNMSATKMIRNTKKVPQMKKEELFWYWCEDYKDVCFTKENFVPFGSYL